MWVDYDNAISLHPVVAGTRAERRAERVTERTDELDGDAYRGSARQNVPAGVRLVRVGGSPEIPDVGSRWPRRRARPACPAHAGSRLRTAETGRLRHRLRAR